MHATDTEIIQNKVRSTKNLMQKSALHMQEYSPKKTQNAKQPVN